MAKQFDIVVKLLLVGDSGVGKTCMIQRFANHNFRKDYHSTIGIDFQMRNIDLDGQQVRVQIWDTAGQERYESLTKQYYRRAQGIFLVYDVSNEKSFRNIAKWFKNVRECANEDVALTLLGSKTDLERAVTESQGKKLAEKLSIPFFETSNVSCENIEEAFISMTKLVLRNRKHEYDALQLHRRESSTEFVSQLLTNEHQTKPCCD
ncbi:DgyrCDS11556 [Dimorphilus gyrociliatus]|uniref:DgyrCDS11556 n=1 Tax=Dimorphilus gyrociliatus TaxID=2664684 RepID=A0A7I8W3Q1_9ANNE|nr:DgyrCDS11556 [Dimorphilus gyrociliatus]